MANFCSNCGAEIKGEFCSRCTNQVRRWEAKYIDNTEGSSNYKGTISLSSSELTFHSYGLLSGNPKERYRIPLTQIKSITRTPLLNIITIKFNKAPQESGALRKFFGSRNIMLKIIDWQSFIQNIQSLNSNIKIKT